MTACMPSEPVNSTPLLMAGDALMVWEDGNDQVTLTASPTGPGPTELREETRQDGQQDVHTHGQEEE